MSSVQTKPAAAVSQTLKALVSRPLQDEHEDFNPVSEVRVGLKDIKAGRVREINHAADLLKEP